MEPLVTAWAAVVAHPLFLIGVTLGAYQLGLALYERTRLAVFHPVLVSVPIVVLVLWLLGLDYPEYREAVLPLVILLGPATVALAVPLYLNLRRIRQFFWPVIITLLLGGAFATLSTIAIGWLLGADHMILMTMVPKSVTSPIAMLVAEQIGGVAALAAVFVMFTGVLGPIFGPPLLRLFRVTHPAAWGMAMGLTAHAVGTSRALEEGKEAGAFAALAMSMMGTATALLLPVGVTLWYLF
ncbi:MAG TPA: LrgB family protein [Pseudomonas xinjiangensis]|uniref:LrgB family protein n=2 Tax=root TaxID=1 RepID=A0A7V1BQC2_9GAMM|nr:LrgB family protein [Halopseudomonas xinjiangensis]HEC47335.1 LrgB family protein [Halopseudomonas xinjiangensis]